MPSSCCFPCLLFVWFCCSRTSSQGLQHHCNVLTPIGLRSTLTEPLPLPHHDTETANAPEARFLVNLDEDKWVVLQRVLQQWTLAAQIFCRVSHISAQQVAFHGRAEAFMGREGEGRVRKEEERSPEGNLKIHQKKADTYTQKTHTPKTHTAREGFEGRGGRGLGRRGGFGERGATRVRLVKCDHAVQLCTCCTCGCTVHTSPVGWLEVFLQATEKSPNFEKKHQSSGLEEC